MDYVTNIVSSGEANDISIKYRVLENYILDINKGLEYKYLKNPSSNLYDMDKEAYLDEYLKSKKSSNKIVSIDM
jgi:predicted transcriptional regulator